MVIDPIIVGVAVAVLVIVLLVVWAMSRSRRRHRLREHFGPEYEHAVKTAGSRSRAERELEDREERVRSFDLRPLAAEDRERFAQSWYDVQARFVDNPSVAVAEADLLVEDLMRARGYPVAEFDDRVAHVSVHHPQLASHYRDAHRIARASEQGKASTETLRQAIMHYRALFETLLDESRPAEPDQSGVRRAS